jgi:DNA-binding response OmpR family regulator
MRMFGERWMRRSVVVTTNDPGVREQLGEFLKKYEYDVYFEKIGNPAILTVLDRDIDIMINDLPGEDDFILKVIGVIRSAKPKLPIIVLNENTSKESIRKLLELGVFYCAMRPMQTGEMEKVLEAIERLHQKEQEGYKNHNIQGFNKVNTVSIPTDNLYSDDKTE